MTNKKITKITKLGDENIQRLEWFDLRKYKIFFIDEEVKKTDFYHVNDDGFICQREFVSEVKESELHGIIKKTELINARRSLLIWLDKLEANKKDIFFSKDDLLFSINKGMCDLTFSEYVKFKQSQGENIDDSEESYFKFIRKAINYGFELLQIDPFCVVYPTKSPSIHASSYLIPNTGKEYEEEKILFTLWSFISRSSRYKYSIGATTILNEVRLSSLMYLTQRLPFGLRDEFFPLYNRKKEDNENTTFDLQHELKEEVQDRAFAMEHHSSRLIHDYTQDTSFYLEINLIASDVQIKEQFNQWLSKTREKHQIEPEIKKNGEIILNKIKNYKVLQILDLMIWQKIEQVTIKKSIFVALVSHAARGDRDFDNTELRFVKCLLDPDSDISKELASLYENSPEEIERRKRICWDK